MMMFIRNWIIQVLVTVIFMVLVDMILPNNNIKKYAKIASGLIVMITILSPVFRLFDKSINVEETIGKYVATFQQNETHINKAEIEKDVQNKTIAAYKEKLKTAIEKTIYDKTGKKYDVVGIVLNEDTGSYSFSEIKGIVVKKNYKDGSIKPVEKVTIGKNATTIAEEQRDKNILEVLSSEFNIKPAAVKFVK